MLIRASISQNRKRTSKLKQVIRLQKNGNQGMSIVQPVWCRVISLTSRVQSLASKLKEKHKTVCHLTKEVRMGKGLGTGIVMFFLVNVF